MKPQSLDPGKSTMSLKSPKRDWNIFLSSVFFVLGFSVVFSIVGVLLQTVLVHASYEVQVWLGRIGGIIIIFFGLFTLGLVSPSFLQMDHKIAVKKRFGSYFITSFVFGAAFAVGWTPCVSAALGAILALAVTQSGSAFILLVSYTLGIGIPFLLVGFFTDQAQRLISKSGKWLTYVQYVFGVILLLLGVLIFTGELSQIANIQFLTNALTAVHGGTSAGAGISGLTIVNIVIALFAGLASFLSPCILPIIPGFLAYLASTAVKKTNA